MSDPFATLDAAPLTPKRDVFRMAVFGDFSGRAARGLMETGAALAKRRAIRLDVDSFDDVIEGFKTTLVLPIGTDGTGIAVELEEFDDLEPDELYDEVEIFEELANLRRQLDSPRTAASAISQIMDWAEDHPAVVKLKRRSGANAVPADRKLTDFQSLIGGAPVKTEAAEAEDLIGRLVGPYIKPGANPDAEALKPVLDEALSAAMRLVLHHPEFQAVEQQWRSLDMLVRQIETDHTLEVILYDISAEEFAADLAASDDLTQSGLYTLLNEAADTPREAFSALFGLYSFEETPPHAHLIGRMAKVAAHVDAPFFAAIAPGFIDTPLKDRHPLVSEAWLALRALPEAAWAGLATPRFLLRRPYGKKTEPISSFAFEEFTNREGLRGMLWANPVVAVAILLAQTRTQGGRAMSLGSVMSLPEMPFHYVTDVHGDQVALPCTERNLTTQKAETVVARGLMPLVSPKGQDNIRLASFQSLAGAEIRGPWSSDPAPRPSPAKAASVSAIIPAAEELEADTDDLDAALAEIEMDLAPDDDAVDFSELDDLLASFGDDLPSDPDEAGDDTEDADDDDELDADLAALLADL